MKPSNKFDEDIVIMDQSEEDELIKVGWGHERIILTKDHIEALLDGKGIGWTDGEYTHMIILEGKEEPQ